jgi:hypothetical protein
MNPTVPQSVIDAALEEDPSRYAAEYLATFRTDIENFIAKEALDGVVNWRALERPPINGRKYVAFVDPSGGSNDSMTLAIAHKENDIGVLDCLRERKAPFSPESAVLEFADLLKQYRITRVRGDRYAGEWPRDAFRRFGIAYDLAEAPKSDLYRDLLPLVNSGKVQLLGNKRLIAQLLGLERRTSRAGKDSIDHAPGGHDDLANAAAGALVDVTRKKPVARMGSIGVDGRISWQDAERPPLRIVPVTPEEYRRRNGIV